MSFDAGSVTGKLQLDTGGFTHSMLEAQGIAELFGPTVTAFIANPLLGAADAFKEVAHDALNTFVDVAADAEKMNLLSSKLGVPVEVFSSWAQFGRTVNVDAEQLANGMRMMSEQVEEALDHIDAKNNKTIEAFNRLGISADFLRDHIGDPMAIFLAIKDGLDKMGDSTLRTSTAMDIFGGRQSALIPLLLKNKEETDSFMSSLEKMGGVTTAQEAIAAQKFNDLRVTTQIAFEGMEKAAAVPLLEFLSNHMKEIQPVLIAAVQQITAEFEKLFKQISADNGKEFLDLLKDMIAGLEDAAKVVVKIIEAFEWIESHPKTVQVIEASVTGGASALPDLNPVSQDTGTGTKIVHAVEDVGSLGMTAEARWAWKHAKGWFSDDDGSGSAGATSGQPAPPPPPPTPAPAVTVNVQTMHVHVGDKSANGPIDAAIQKHITKAKAQAAAQANSASTVGGSP